MNYSSIGRRFLGTLIDFFIVFSLSLFINRFIFLGWIFSLCLNALYFPFFWASKAQATPGKYLMKTFVTDMHGNRISIKQAFLRYICSFISSALLGFGYLLALFTNKKQTLHDLFMGTVVVDGDIVVEEGLLAVWIEEIKETFNSLQNKTKSDQQGL